MEKNTSKKSDGIHQNNGANLVVLSEFEFLETIGVGKIYKLFVYNNKMNLD